MDKQLDKRLKEEFTTDMHSEMKISKELEEKHKAKCVWTLTDGTEENIKKYCSLYKISYEKVMKYKPQNKKK